MKNKNIMQNFILPSILTCFFLLSSLFIVKAQIFPTAIYCKAKKEHKPHCGIKKDRNFDAIIKTNISKDALIAKTKDFFIAEKLILPSEIDVAEYDENNSEYKLRFMFRQNIFMGKMMGMQAVKPPLKVYFDARLVFQDNGLWIIFENYSEKTFSMVKEDGKTIDNTTPISTYPKLQDIFNYALFENPGFILKSLVWANNGIPGVQEMKKNRPEFRKILDESFNVLDNLAEDGKAKWLTDKDMLDYTMPHNKYFNSIVQRNIDDGKFISLDNNRWNNYFEPNFVFFVSMIAELIDGEIESFGLDGEKYEIKK